METTMEPILLDIDQVAAKLGCSRSNVRRMWYDGLLPKPIRLGRRGIRWRVNELDEFIQSKRPVTPAGKSE